MNIINAIKDRAVNYEVRTGESPSNVYLGRAEVNHLKKTINSRPHHSLNVINGATFDGMTIFPVDADSHLEVS